MRIFLSGDYINCLIQDQFIESCDGWGYKYLHPPARDVKILNDMIFGGAGLMHPSPNMKLHHLGDHSLMWSSVLQAPHPTRPTKASDQSLGSSFGCSFGSFNVNDSSTGNLFKFSLNIKVDTEHC